MQTIKPKSDHDAWHNLSTDAVLKKLQTNATGLSEAEVDSRLASFGAKHK